MILIAIFTRGYKPTYNWGGLSCKCGHDKETPQKKVDLPWFMISTISLWRYESWFLQRFTHFCDHRWMDGKNDGQFENCFMKFPGWWFQPL